MIHRLLKILTPVLQHLLRYYLRKTRPYRYKGIHVTVEPGVFYPGFIFSTRLLLEFLDKQDLSGKKFLELGAGCGIISLLAARKGAMVTASDINPAAVENMKENARSNKLEMNIIESDLFQNINREVFDWIIINPPYYPENPKDTSAMAWFCGRDFEYFKKLFPQLREFSDPSCRIIMIL